VTAIPDDVVLDIAITQLHGIVVGNDLLVIADAAAQIANPGREAHLWNWRLVGTGPYKHVGDLSDLTFRLGPHSARLTRFGHRPWRCEQSPWRTQGGPFVK
jgi:hypothetical protein